MPYPLHWHLRLLLSNGGLSTQSERFPSNRGGLLTGIYCRIISSVLWTGRWRLFRGGSVLSGGMSQLCNQLYIGTYWSQVTAARYRPVIISVLVLSIISMMLCAWAPNFNFFTVSYFFAGCFLFGYETTVYIYISEISGRWILRQRWDSRQFRSTCLRWCGRAHPFSLRFWDSSIAGVCVLLSLP
jgi:hypothetical protein